MGLAACDVGSEEPVGAAARGRFARDAELLVEWAGGDVDRAFRWVKTIDPDRLPMTPEWSDFGDVLRSGRRLVGRMYAAQRHAAKAA